MTPLADFKLEMGTNIEKEQKRRRRKSRRRIEEQAVPHLNSIIIIMIIKRAADSCMKQTAMATYVCMLETTE